MSNKVISKKTKTIAYLLPIFFVIVYLLIFFVLPPKIYEKGLSVGAWLTKNPSAIIDFLSDKKALVPLYEIWCIKIVFYILIAGVIASLFFLGWVLQNKTPNHHVDAIYIGKDVYLKIIEINSEVQGMNDIDSTTKREVQIIADKLKNESDFGFGDKSVINLENEIANCIANMEDILNNNIDINKAQEEMLDICGKIKTKLKMRSELKKR